MKSRRLMGLLPRPRTTIYHIVKGGASALCGTADSNARLPKRVKLRLNGWFAKSPVVPRFRTSRYVLEGFDVCVRGHVRS